jgi:hypothetical protein
MDIYQQRCRPLRDSENWKSPWAGRTLSPILARQMSIGKDIEGGVQPFMLAGISQALRSKLSAQASGRLEPARWLLAGPV